MKKQTKSYLVGLKEKRFKRNGSFNKQQYRLSSYKYYLNEAAGTRVDDEIWINPLSYVYTEGNERRLLKFKKD